MSMRLRDNILTPEAIRKQALSEGFCDVGIAPASLSPITQQRFRQWIEDGKHGDMIWMENRIDQRINPRILWDDAQSVIMLGMSYAPSSDPFLLEDHKSKGRISVYARGKDYHDVVKKALKRLARWIVDESGEQVKVFVDTAPVMEKALAANSGVGWRGKHSNIVSKTHGNWMFLAAIYTSAKLDQSETVQDHCGSCTACAQICPTHALDTPYTLDARACISWMTIENKGPIALQYREAIGNHIYGCDDCLAICPWNKFADSAATHKAFFPRAELEAPELADLLRLDDTDFRTIFSGSPIKRTGRNKIIRNALIAAGNSNDPNLLPPILDLLDDESDIVRGAAIWALKMLDEPRFILEKAVRYPNETDKSICAEWNAICPTLSD